VWVSELGAVVHAYSASYLRHQGSRITWVQDSMFAWARARPCLLKNRIKNKKEILSYVTTWIYLKGIMPSEISQSQKFKYYISKVEGGGVWVCDQLGYTVRPCLKKKIQINTIWFYLYEVSQIIKLIETESKMRSGTSGSHL
jgi:hypothetical protein